MLTTLELHRDEYGTAHFWSQMWDCLYDRVRIRIVFEPTKLTVFRVANRILIQTQHQVTHEIITYLQETT